jgi:ABC-type Fe3+ transport system substrate-binding protein
MNRVEQDRSDSQLKAALDEIGSIVNPDVWTVLDVANDEETERFTSWAMSDDINRKVAWDANRLLAIRKSNEYALSPEQCAYAVFLCQRKLLLGISNGEA